MSHFRGRTKRSGGRGPLEKTGEVGKIEEHEWVALAMRGSQEACGEIVRRYERPVFSLIVRMVKDPAVAEELAQDTFLKVFRSLDTYEPGRKFSSWLFKIAHNTTLDHLRRKRIDTLPLEGESEEDRGLGERLADTAARTPEALAASSHLGEALEAAIHELRPEYREVILLRFHEGLAYQEIGEIMGLPLGTVKTYIFRARKELAGILGEMGWGLEGGAG